MTDGATQVATVWGQLNTEDDAVMATFDFTNPPAYMSAPLTQPMPELREVHIDALYASIGELSRAFGLVINGLLRRAPLLSTIKITSMPTWLVRVPNDPDRC